MARGVTVALHRHLCPIRLVDGRVAAGGSLAVRVVAHVLHVGLPAGARGGELGADVLDVRRIDAARAALDSVRQQRVVSERREGLAVDLVLEIGRLARDDRDVVVVRVVAGGVVVTQQNPALGQRARQVRERRRITEGRGVALVLQHDHEDMLDRRQLVGLFGRLRAARAQAASSATIVAASSTGVLLKAAAVIACRDRLAVWERGVVDRRARWGRHVHRLPPAREQRRLPVGPGHCGLGDRKRIRARAQIERLCDPAPELLATFQINRLTSRPLA